MYLRKLALLNFKNIAEGEFSFGPGINCLVGDNGAGKTNIIDAVYYLSMCKSAFGMTDGQSIRHGAEFFMAEGHYSSDRERTEQIVCSFARKSGKVVKRNGKVLVPNGDLVLLEGDCVILYSQERVHGANTIHI